MSLLVSLMYGARPVWTLLAVMLLVVLAPPGLAVHEADYDVTFSGQFRLYPLAGENLTDELFFTGEGHGEPFGTAQVDGYSRTQNGPDGCATIVHDEVTVAVADGSLSLVNTGRDCVELLAEPGHVVIEGSGSTEIVGGTGLYAGVRGTGAWTVTAEVTGAGPGYVEGTFDLLRFAGQLH